LKTSTIILIVAGVGVLFAVLYSFMKGSSGQAVTVGTSPASTSALQSALTLAPSALSAIDGAMGTISSGSGGSDADNF
jgi:hypothetical protein